MKDGYLNFVFLSIIGICFILPIYEVTIAGIFSKCEIPNAEMSTKLSLRIFQEFPNMSYGCGLSFI